MDRDERHSKLVEELVMVFKKEGFRILSADLPGYPTPRPLPNDGYGDQKPKSPDVYAFDSTSQRHVIGEAKTGDDDFETEHALTQYNVFLDQFDKSTGVQAKVYIIVPGGKIAEFNTMITHYIHRDYWQSLVVVSSTQSEGSSGGT
ncbi:MAG: hypothetical protein HYW57_00220 [Ignavibacteriales bacterium]|nr:hypothetical protein [Ignavibacteriales bacterium]